MGTRSLTKIFDNDGVTEIFCMYKQYDGYIEGGFGDDLRNLLQDYVENCSNYSAKEIETLIRAVYLSGGIDGCEQDTHIEPIGTSDVGEEFTYLIYCDPTGILPPYVMAMHYDNFITTWNFNTQNKC
jgi:hypothetical protein